MVPVPVNILLIEDDEVDFRWVRRALLETKDGEFSLEWAPLLQSGIERLYREKYHLILLDLSLPDSHGLETFISVRNVAPTIPVIVLSGDGETSVAMGAIAKGAQDYLIKGQVDGPMLERVIRYSLERRRVQEMREEFVGMVVHDLGSPLTTSIQSVGLILEGSFGPVSERQRSFLTMAHNNMQKLRRMTINLLEVTKAELGKVKLFRESFDLVALAKELIGSFQQLAQNKGLEIREAFSVGKLEIFADKDKMEQVFTNLIGNALKFTDRGYVEVGVREKGHFVECGVVDTGTGIQEKSLKDVFNRFEQFNEDKERQKLGSGLGLAIVKGIVTAHGGEIWVESKLTEGTRFTFVIPRFAGEKTRKLALNSAPAHST
jgi:signal transduction histidine kinase